MSDTELTKLRRTHIGFVFQFFNLLPMLNAEENVVLPLSIAGDEAGQGVARAAARRRRSRRAALAPSVGALRRPAAARRDRACARLAADRALRRRADGQPRLDDERRDPRPAPRVGEVARPDDGDGHAASTSPWVTAPIETSATTGSPSLEGTAIASGLVPVSGASAVRVAQAPWGRCRQERHVPGLRKPAHPVAERAGREARRRERRDGTPICPAARSSQIAASVR